jgi:hypothetical protein
VRQQQAEILAYDVKAQGMNCANHRSSLVLESLKPRADFVGQVLRDHAVERNDQNLPPIGREAIGMEDSLDAAHQTEGLASPRPGLDSNSRRVRIDQRQHLLAANTRVPRVGHWRQVSVKSDRSEGKSPWTPLMPIRGKMAKHVKRIPLTADEREGIVLAVSSAFRKLKNLYARIVPFYEDFGFKPPSPGVGARDLSEKIEKAIAQHCDSFSKGAGHKDLCRHGQDWDVKVCGGSGLTINAATTIKGENYIVVNYKAATLVKAVWVLWDAQDGFFSDRVINSNARRVKRDAAARNIEILFEAPKTVRRKPPQ